MGATAFCFDLDGTVTAQEILPRIAREADLYEEMQILTEATVAGVIPFEKSFRLRCRLLREVPISTVRKVVSTVPLQPAVTEFIRAHPEQCFIVSGNLDVWIAPLLDRIPCHFFTSKASVENDRLLGIEKSLDKGATVRGLRDRFENIVVIGEGMNDVPMFESADVRIAHGAIHAPCAMVRELADYVTVSPEGLCRLITSLL